MTPGVALGGVAVALRVGRAFAALVVLAAEVPLVAAAVSGVGALFALVVGAAARLVGIGAVGVLAAARAAPVDGPRGARRVRGAGDVRGRAALEVREAEVAGVAVVVVTTAAAALLEVDAERPVGVADAVVIVGALGHRTRRRVLGWRGRVLGWRRRVRRWR